MEGLGSMFNLGGSKGKIIRRINDLYNYHTDLLAESSLTVCCCFLDMMEPSFYLHPKSTLASRGDIVELTCGARGLPRPNITWRKDGFAFTDASATVTPSNQNDSSELIVKIISVSDRHVGYYSCRATT